MTITRRTALQTGLLGGAAACSSTPALTPFTAVSSTASAAFAHGVASGDPDATSVVIWTRVSGAGNATEVSWQVAADEGFQSIIADGKAITGAHRDGTVKVVADGLSAGGRYFFRFNALGENSPVGRTRTLPTGAVDQARFAVVSCSNYPFGYFNVYDQIARRDDLNAVIHLGDYLYEYSPRGYGGEVGEKIGRRHNPDREIVTLEDYRLRHAQYKADPSARAMHGNHPMIAIWDDHETANNSWKDGAQNHSPEREGDWSDRRAAALQAYYEWMPVRDPAPGRPREALFKDYAFGDLMTLSALETRLMARARQFEYSDIVPTLKSPQDIANFRDNILWDGSRDMLGTEQLDYIANSFQRAKVANQPWRLIANQIIMADVVSPDLTPHVSEEDIVELEKQWDQARAFVEFSKLGLPQNLDAWDGYPAARERFYETAASNGAEGMIVITGDTHTWWANDLTRRNGDAMGVELGVNSVTSPSPYRREFLGGKGAEYALLTNRENKSIRYLSGEGHGYIDLLINHKEAEARFMAVDTVETPQYNAFQRAAFKIAKKNGAAAFKDIDGVGFKEGFLF